MAFSFTTRPSPPLKPAEKPKPAVKPGILGEHGYKSFSDMREFARKSPFKAAPTYDTPLSEQQRVKIINDLQKYSGQSFGLSPDKYREALDKMKKEKASAGDRNDFKKIRELDETIKQAEVWKNEWEKSRYGGK